METMAYRNGRVKNQESRPAELLLENLNQHLTNRIFDEVGVFALQASYYGQD